MIPVPTATQSELLLHDTALKPGVVDPKVCSTCHEPVSTDAAAVAVRLGTARPSAVTPNTTRAIAVHDLVKVVHER